MTTNEENERLGLTVDEARKRLGELITDIYFDIKEIVQFLMLKYLQKNVHQN